MDELLKVENLNISFKSSDGNLDIVEDLSFSILRRETLGIVGESGSGKSITSLAVMRLLPSNSAVVEGKITLDNECLSDMTEKEMQSVRGNHVSMIFQEPMTSLNPTKTCGNQIMEPLLLHRTKDKNEAKEKTLELLTLCGIPEPNQRFMQYPHQLSGGMRQRVMIAIALACSPKLLIADEPTTALDVTIQAQILDLMKSIKAKSDMSIMIITHDLAIVSDFCDRVIIMYTGQIMEEGLVSQIFNSPKHPYTAGLINAIPKLNERHDRLIAVEGMVPDIKDMPHGCHYHPRCKFAAPMCLEKAPPLITLDDGRKVRCFLFSNEQ